MKQWTLAFVCLGPMACTTPDGGGPLGLVFLDKNQHVASAEPLFAKDEDICLDSPIFFSSLFTGKVILNGIPTKYQKPCAALAAAYDQLTQVRPLPTDKAAVSALFSYTKARRNELLDALVATSKRKCGRYVSFLKAYDGNVNVSFGLVSLLTAGLAPVAGGEATAKALGASSAIVGGAKETFKQTHFANQTVQVLAAAFEKARDRKLREISNY